MPQETKAGKREETKLKRECNFVFHDKSPVTSLKLLEPIVKINGIEIKAIIDTGSSLSLIDKELVDEHQLPTRKTTGMKVRLLNNAKEELDETVKVEIFLGDKIYRHKFYVYENLKFKILLGIDFCRASKTELRFDHGKHEGTLAEQITNGKKSEIRVEEEVEIKGKSLAKVKCSANVETEVSFFKPDKKLLEDFQLIMHETLINSNDLTIFVYNPNEHDAILFKNMKIGYLTGVAEVFYDHQTFVIEKSTTYSEKDFKIFSGSNEEKKRILEILENNRELFGENVSHLGKAVGIEHKIELTTDKPIKLRSYRHSPKEKEIIRSQVDEMLSSGVIEES